MKKILRNSSLIVMAMVAIGLFSCGGDSDAPIENRFTLQRVFPGLSFSAPVAMIQAPRDNSRWFVVEQAGRVRVFANNPAVATMTLFVDISARVAFQSERGLLGMAFHPDFPAVPRVYFFYSVNGAGLTSRISEFLLAAGGLALDPASERILLTIVNPETNHNGGGIAFGPDGFLYAGVGDGGGANDQHGAIGNAQSLTTLHGKMLRIDVNDSSVPYGIPAGNPFAGNALCAVNGTGAQNCPEIFAYGLRNPWRWSFDRLTGQLWAADVGQNALEEVNRVVRNGNYGWRCFEGTRNTGLPCGTQPNALPPVAQYGRETGVSVTGGFVYRGAAVAALAGRYVFGDFGSGRIFDIPESTQPTRTISGGFASGLNIASFAEGVDGELYVVDYGGGIYRISP